MQQIEQLKAQKGSTATDYVSLIEEIMPSIVLIETDLGFGSGFFVDSYGDILTNYHIVKDALKILVTTQNNDRVNAQLKKYDDKRDIALLTIQWDEPTTFLRISNTLPKQGEKILAIGNPEGFIGTVSDGIVSAVRKANNNIWIQFTAPVSPGSSGGVLVNMLGEVVGMPSLGMKAGISFLDENYQYDYDYGDTPLHTAATYNHNPKSIIFLISQGIDVNARATSGNSIFETPLSCAVRNKNLEAIKELLKAGANPNSYSSSANYDLGILFISWLVSIIAIQMLKQLLML